MALVVFAAGGGCSSDPLPPCSTPVAAFVESPVESGILLDPSPNGPRSVAAGLDKAGCLKIAFSVSDSACGAFGSAWLLLEVCDPRPGSFAIPAAASTNRAQDGVVVLERYEPDVQVTGRFTAGNLGGTFDALFCGSTSCAPDPGTIPD